MVITNAKWWDGLPPDVCKGLQEAMDEATTYGNGLANEYNLRDRKRIEDAHKARIQAALKSNEP